MSRRLPAYVTDNPSPAMKTDEHSAHQPASAPHGSHARLSAPPRSPQSDPPSAPSKTDVRSKSQSDLGSKCGSARRSSSPHWHPSPTSAHRAPEYPRATS